VIQKTVASVVLGAVDAGSNAIRVVVAEVRVDAVGSAPTPAADKVRKLAQERLEVRLGTGAFTRRRIDRDTMDQAVGAFKRIRELFKLHNVTHYRAVATSAVRDAANAEALRQRIFRESGIDLAVISGDEEARLVRKAVARALGADCPPCIVDLGGGSLEVNFRKTNTTPWQSLSLPIGTVRLMESFGINDSISDAESAMIRRYTVTSLKSALGDTMPTLGKAAMCGGNAEALAKLFGTLALQPAGASTATPPGMPTLTLRALDDALPAILSASVQQRMAQYGIRKDRAEVMGLAALIFSVVARQLGVNELVSPGVGLRDAVLFELIDALADAESEVVSAADQAVLTAARDFNSRMNHDGRHGEHVRELARSLFSQTRDLHKLTDRDAVLLEAAAILHDVGEVVHSRGHQKHSEYLIRHGQFAGLTDSKRGLVAAIVRCHRKTAADVRKYLAADGTLSKEDRTLVRRLASLLRIADGLDIDHRQCVESVVVSRQGGVITLDLDVAAEAKLAKPEDLLRKGDLFSEEFDVTLQAIRLKNKRKTAPETTPAK